MFGFYPQDSVVLMGFQRQDSQLSLGPVARLDTDDLEYELEAAFDVVSEDHDVVFAFLITSREPAEIDYLIDELFFFESIFDRGIDACWRTPAVTLGEPYELCFGPANLDSIHGDGWVQGTIPSIISAESMRPWINQGRLPEPTRDDAHALWSAPNPHITAHEAAEAQARAQESAQVMLDAVWGDATPADAEALDRAAGLEDSLRAALAAAGRQAAGPTPGLLQDSDLLSQAAEWLSRTQLRDVALAAVLDAPEEGAALMAAVARTFDGGVRVNALALYAAAQSTLGLPMLAAAALSTALMECPTHRLSSLMLETYRRGLQHRVREILDNGCVAARKAWRADVERARRRGSGSSTAAA